MGVLIVVHMLQFIDKENGTSLGKYCGNQTFSLVSSSNGIRVVFRSDYVVVSSGFTLDWSCKLSLADLILRVYLLLDGVMFSITACARRFTIIQLKKLLPDYYC